MTKEQLEKMKLEDHQKYPRISHCAVCEEPLIPHPDCQNVPSVHANPNYLICPTMKCGHHGIDHIHKFPTIWNIFKNKGKEFVTCARPGCKYVREMDCSISC